MYSHTYDKNLLILKYADLIISPDSYWQKQLTELGYKNVVFGNFANLPTINPFENPLPKTHDLLYIGYNHEYNWGYKKLLFLNKFSEFNLSIYGSGGAWDKWLQYFPELKKKYFPLKKRLSDKEYFNLISSSKLLILELNPSFYNGFHIRFFEAINAGCLPIIEYKSDLLNVFENIKVPTLKDFKHPKELINYYSNNENERLITVKNLYNYLNSSYMPGQLIQKYIENYL